MIDSRPDPSQLDSETSEYEDNVIGIKAVTDSHSSPPQSDSDSNEINGSIAKIGPSTNKPFSQRQLNPNAREFSPQNHRESVREPKGAPGFLRVRRSVSLDSKSHQQGRDPSTQPFRTDARDKENRNQVLNSFFTMHSQISRFEDKTKVKPASAPLGGETSHPIGSTRD